MLEKVSFVINEIDFPCFKAKCFTDYNVTMNTWEYFKIYYSYMTDITALTWNYYFELYHVKKCQSFMLYFLKNIIGHQYIKGFSNCQNFNSNLYYNDVIMDFMGTNIREMTETDNNIVPVKFTYTDFLIKPNISIEKDKYI